MPNSKEIKKMKKKWRKSEKNNNDGNFVRILLYECANGCQHGAEPLR